MTKKPQRTAPKTELPAHSLFLRQDPRLIARLKAAAKLADVSMNELVAEILDRALKVRGF